MSGSSSSALVQKEEMLAYKGNKGFAEFRRDLCGVQFELNNNELFVLKSCLS